MISPSGAESWCTPCGRDLLLRLRIQPRASRDAIDGLHAGRLRVRLGAPPVDGAANARLLEFLALTLAVPRRRLSLVRGEKHRDKDVLLADGAVDSARTATLLRSQIREK